MGSDTNPVMRDLFLRDPCREVDRIIKATELDPARLGLELEEYVVTEGIRKDLHDILDDFVETRRRLPESVCVWVSGWFGSGKSHFLKVIGALVGNLDIVRPERRERRKASVYFCEKWRLPHGSVLDKEFHTKTVFVNLLDYLGTRPPPLSEIIYVALMKSLGYASIPWVARLEQALAQRGLFEQFKEWIERQQGAPWEKVREDPLLVRGVMAEALHAVDSRTWRSVEVAGKAIEDLRGELRINPQWTAQRLTEEAQRLHEERGRIAILLDEVGLYIGRAEASRDRLGELIALAEAISRKEVGGRVWLFATSQEALEEVIPEVLRRGQEFERLRDRFRTKVTLMPENIEEVVRVRLLDKVDGPGLAFLQRIFRENQGSLVTHACIHNVSRDQVHYSQCSEEDFLRFYPLMPYYIRLVQEILNQLRAKHLGERGFTGRERATLGVIQTMLCDKLRNEPVGRLATFDALFDAIEGELASLRGAEASEIRGMASLGSHNGVSAQAVAKALYLLQHAGPWLPTTVENVTAVLYPSLGADGQQLLDGVRESLQELVRRVYVGEREGSFHFLSESERTFEKDVERARGRAEVVGAAKKAARVQQLAEEVLEDFSRIKFHGVRDLDIQLRVDGEPLKTKGHLILDVISPLGAYPVEVNELEVQTAREASVVFLHATSSDEFKDALERALAMEYVINEKQRAGVPAEDRPYLQDRERDLDGLKHDRLPDLFRRALAEGRVVAGGETRTVENGDWKARTRQALEERAEAVFPEFRLAAGFVKEDDIDKLLRHRGGALPGIVRDLKIVDDEGNVREDGPLTSRISRELERREGRQESTRGADLIAHFGAPPYGWEGRVTRLALAALFKHGSVWVEAGGSEYHSSAQAGANRMFLDSREFNRTAIHLGEAPSPAQRLAAAKLVAELFGMPGLEALDEVGEALGRGLEDMAHHAQRLASRLRDLGVGDSSELDALADRSQALNVGRASQVILAVLRAAESENLQDRLLALKQLIRFEEEGNLEKATSWTRFLDIAQSVDPARASRLRILLRDRDLPSKWQATYDEIQSLKASYEQAYVEAHVRAAQAVEDARRVVGQWKAKYPDLDLSATDLEPPWACSLRDATGVEHEPFTCAECQSPLVQLVGVPERVDAWKARLQQAVARRELKKRGGEAPASLALDETVRSMSELQAFEAQVRAFAEETFRQGGKVKIKGEARRE